MGPPGSEQLPPLRVHAKGVNKAVIKQRLIRVRLIFTSSKSLSAGIQKLKSKDWGPQLERTFDSRRQPRMDLGLVDACPRLVDSIIAASVGIKQIINEIRLSRYPANLADPKSHPALPVRASSIERIKLMIPSARGHIIGRSRSQAIANGPRRSL